MTNNLHRFLRYSLTIFISANFLKFVRSSSNSLRRELRQDERSSSDLRFVTFGTSVTHGAMMEHPENAYPYLLSPNVENKAMRASDSSYPSMCTQTMLKDAIYDVIIIEYDRRRFECLEVFVKRLRQRFPDATIILTKMWNLMDIQVRPKNGKINKLREFLVESGHPMISEKALEYVMGLDADISFFDRLDSRDVTYDRIAEENNVFVYEWDHTSDIRDLIRYRFRFFVDLVHPNDYGHKIIAKDIQSIISKVKPKRSDKLGSWGDGDFCSSWFQTGEQETEALISRLTPIKLFDEKNRKYAIELRKKGSTAMLIHNPFDGPRKLYLTYMSTFPNRLYPKVSVYMSGQPEENKIIIDPVAPYDFPVHVQDTQEVGNIRPGRNVLKIEPLEQTDKPFRLVGFAITNGDYIPSDMYFKPEKLDVSVM